MKKLLYVLISAVFITLSLLGCGSNTASTTPSTLSKPASTAPASTAASVESNEVNSKKTDDGDWIKLNKEVTVADIKYVINRIKFSNGSDLLEAEDGKDYLYIDITVKNNTAEEAALSSVLMFVLKDSKGKEYDISLGGLASLDAEKLKQLDGSVAAKSERNGALAYEIPEKSTGLTLTIKDIVGDGAKSIQLD